MLAVLIAALGYAAGPMTLRAELSDLDPRATMGASLAIATVLLTPLTAVTFPTETPPADALVAVMVLGLLCTAAAFVIFGTLIAEVGAGRALVITYVNPVVALALGMAVLGERPGAGAIAGLPLILAGSWLSTGSRLPPGSRGRCACGGGPRPAAFGTCLTTSRSLWRPSRGAMHRPAACKGYETGS